MKRVVDPNVVISALLNRGNSLEIFIKNFSKKKFNFITPQYFIVELGRKTEKIVKKTKFSYNEVLEMIDFIIDQITFVIDEEYSSKIELAKEILKGHEKDVPYLALALAKNCDILSGDKIFKNLCPDRVKNPSEVLKMFEE